MVVHKLGPECRDSSFHLWLIAQVDTVDGRVRVDVVLIPSTEVVEHGDLLAGGDIRVYDMGAYKPGSTSHQDSHGD